LQVEADLLRRVPVTGPPTMIVVVGIGQQFISMYELNNMASWPYDRNAIVVRSHGDLFTVESRLNIAICASKYFLPRNVMHSVDYAAARRMSVCLSVSHTPVL